MQARKLKTAKEKRRHKQQQKEQERGELHRTIWNIANDLRVSVDGWPPVSRFSGGGGRGLKNKVPLKN